MRALSCLAAALLLAACAGPRPLQPQDAAIALPGHWRNGGGSSAAEVGGQWWRQFGDPVLDQLVQQALDANPDLALAAARVREAQALANLADAQLAPNLSAALDGGRQRAINAFGRGATQNVRQGQFQLAYEADLFGRLAAADAAARAGLLASVAARDTVQLGLAAAVVNSYVSLRTIEARLALLRQTLAARRTALELVQRRAASGYAAQLELRQAAAEFHATAQLIPAAELAAARAEAALALLQGQAPSAPPPSVPLAALALPDVPLGLPSRLLERRPDLAQAAQQLAAADYGLDAARAAFMPSIRLAASAGRADASLIPEAVNVFALGGSVLAPLFDAGRLRAQADAATARRDQAAYAYRKAVLTAFREVEDALAAVALSAQQEAALAQQCAALQDSLALATRRYRAGYAAYLEPLDAQRSLLSAQLALAQARGDRLAATAALFQSTGGGWQAGAIVFTTPKEQP